MKTEKLKLNLEDYFKKYNCLPKRIRMSLKYYNDLCEEDIPGVIKIFPKETIFGVDVDIIPGLPYNHEFI